MNPTTPLHDQRNRKKKEGSGRLQHNNTALTGNAPQIKDYGHHCKGYDWKQAVALDTHDAHKVDVTMTCVNLCEMYKR